MQAAMKSDKKTKIRKKRKYDTFLCIIGIILVIFILILICKIILYLIDGQKSCSFSKALQNSVIIMDRRGHEGEYEEEHEDSEKVQEQDAQEGEKDRIPIAIDFYGLYEISKDAVAWLYAPDTEINYVVAQAEDNSYYLHHLLNGEYASGGTLFTDCRNHAGFTDWNTVIYGHNMKNGTMLASLMDYRIPGYYEEHPMMYLYMPEHRYKLELIAGYTTNISDLIYSIPATKEERDEIIDHAHSASSFISGIAIGEEDKLVTLSTCSYAYDDARYVVIGRIVEE